MSDVATGAPVHERPLAISLLLGISGWVAGGFLLLFVVLLFHPDTAGQAAFAGLIMLGAAWGLFKVDGEGSQVFVSQFAMTLSVAGQCLALYAMAKDLHSLAQISGAALVLQVALLLVMPNGPHRTLSTLFALIAWAMTVRFGLFGGPSYASGDTTRYIPSLPAALAAWVLAWGPVVAMLWWCLRQRKAWAPALSAVIAGLIGGLAFATLASYPFEASRWFGNDQRSMGGLAMWPVLSAVGALCALMASFELRSRGLMAMCLIAALLHVGHFYYALGVSLLAKSLLMLVVGAACLAAAHALRTKEAA